jgi:chromosome segregation ATPase
MKIKHKVIKEFQYLSPDKKIFILKLGTILEDYVYKIKSDLITIDKDIIDNNLDFFIVVDWKSELLAYLKSNKIAAPAVLSKKLYPFMEEFILQSPTEQVSVPVLDNSRSRELDDKEFDLTRREKRLKEKEEDLEARLNKVEKRENEYKADVRLLDKREDDIRQRSTELTNKELDFQEKAQELSERERNIDSEILEASKDMDGKYSELQKKIDEDIKSVTEKENRLETELRELNNSKDFFVEYKLEVERYNTYLADKVTEITNWRNVVEPHIDHAHLSRFGIVLPRFPELEIKEIKKTS